MHRPARRILVPAPVPRAPPSGSLDASQGSVDELAAIVEGLHVRWPKDRIVICAD